MTLVTSPHEQAITWVHEPDGVLLATLDPHDAPMNLLDARMLAALDALATQVEGDAAVTGLVLRSGKDDFLIGADIDAIRRLDSAVQAFEASMVLKAVLRRLERCGRPVVALMHGRCLGGGLELALACHQRIVVDDGRARLGLPEIRLGLIPGGGGTQRLPRLTGMQRALGWMAEGSEFTAAEALAAGVVQALAPDAATALAQARAWIAAHPRAQQPWDAPGFRYPGGDSRSPAAAQLFALAPSVASRRSWGNYPALTHLQSAVFEGGLLDFDNALAVESRYFAACAMSAESRALIDTLWYQLRAVRRGASRPALPASAPVRRLGVLGAGMMGAGIAHVAARAGMEVVLLDRSQAQAEDGKAHVQAQQDRAVAQGRRRADERDALLARIHPTTSFDDLAGCELVIEAVFEDRAVKAEVTRQAEARLPQAAVFASNTSTLPITGLAGASARPDRFIGLHFFSPVEKMPLVEVIVGRQTSDQTLARGFDFVRQLGFTPIVVNDARGFYTSRVFATYLMEGLAMLGEGVHPRRIEVAGLQAGMPMPPLALQDEVSLSLALQVLDQARRDFAAEGRPWVAHPGEAVLRRLCEAGRVGRKAGRGCYDWPMPGETGLAEGRRLWPGLAGLFPTAPAQPAQAELIDRLRYVQANEAARCLHEGVLRSVADGNVGAILGWGFAPFLGGPLRFIDDIGPAAFAARCRVLAGRHGPRFEPAANVLALAAAGERFGNG